MGMSYLRLSDYGSASLQLLVDKLESDYYSAIERLGGDALRRTNQLKELEVHQSTSQYIVLCGKLVADILQYVRDRKEYFIPYLRELSAKEEANHNCGTCEGKCKVGHENKLIELKESNLKIKDILYRLQMTSLPLYSETTFPDLYRILRNQMVLLENTLTETYFIEDSYLIPKIAETQKKINAGG